MTQSSNTKTFPGGDGRFPLCIVCAPIRPLLMDREPGETYLQLGCTALAAHSVATGAEGGVDLLLAAYHAQHGLLQLAQLLLEHSGLLAAEALTAAAAHAAVGGLQRRAGGALVASGDKVHNTGVVQSPPGVVVYLLGCSFDVKDILLAKVNVLIEKERCQVALQVTTVLHHDGAGDCVTPEGKRGHLIEY